MALAHIFPHGIFRIFIIFQYTFKLGDLNVKSRYLTSPESSEDLGNHSWMAKITWVWPAAISFKMSTKSLPHPFSPTYVTHIGYYVLIWIWILAPTMWIPPWDLELTSVFQASRALGRTPQGQCYCLALRNQTRNRRCEAPGTLPGPCHRPPWSLSHSMCPAGLTALRNVTSKWPLSLGTFSDPQDILRRKVTSLDFVDHFGPQGLKAPLVDTAQKFSYASPLSSRWVSLSNAPKIGKGLWEEECPRSPPDRAFQSLTILSLSQGLFSYPTRIILGAVWRHLILVGQEKYTGTAHHFEEKSYYITMQPSPLNIKFLSLLIILDALAWIFFEFSIFLDSYNSTLDAEF